MAKQIPFVNYLVLGDKPHLEANECTSCGARFMTTILRTGCPSGEVNRWLQAGNYDRALASVARHSAGGPLIVAVVFDDEVLDRVPAEPHDWHVDAVVTPTQVRVF